MGEVDGAGGGEKRPDRRGGWGREKNRAWKLGGAPPEKIVIQTGKKAGKKKKN